MQPKIRMRNQLKVKIRELEIGDTIAFPISKTPSVRTSASEIGLMLKRRYSTYTDREASAVYVTRKE